MRSLWFNVAFGLTWLWSNDRVSARLRRRGDNRFSDACAAFGLTVGVREVPILALNRDRFDFQPDRTFFELLRIFYFREFSILRTNRDTFIYIYRVP